jgi:hypothetical protein
MGDASMAWHLNEDISFCRLDNRLFFLDLHNDRYFQLSSALERRFLDYLAAPEAADIDFSGLAKYNLLASADEIACGRGAQTIEPPTHSVLESPDLNRRITASEIGDAFVVVAKTRRQLKSLPLKSVLGKLCEYRRAKTELAVHDNGEAQQRTGEAASAFNRMRPFVPIETRCLIDSLSMVRYLAQRGLRSNLVLGVACDPFSAHAWVQSGSLVLNDTVGNALAHVPIRVI